MVGIESWRGFDPLQLPLFLADSGGMDDDDLRTCTNNQCGQEMFVLAEIYLCEDCDMVVNPANVED